MKPIIERGCRWRIRDGKQIWAWSDTWVLNNNFFKPITVMPYGLENIRVCDLWILNSLDWDMELLKELLKRADVGNILKLHGNVDGFSDAQICHFDKKGLYSIKSSCRVTFNFLQSIYDEVQEWVRK